MSGVSPTNVLGYRAASVRGRGNLPRVGRHPSIASPARSAPIPTESLSPLSFDATPPTPGAAEYPRDPSVRLLADFFREKGLEQLKREDRDEGWYPDWIAYQARHGLYAGLLSPKAYSTRGHQLDLLRLTRFVESFGYFSPAHA